MVITIIFLLLIIIWVILGVLRIAVQQFQPWQSREMSRNRQRLLRWWWKQRHALAVMYGFFSVITIVAAIYYFAIFGGFWVPILWVLLGALVGQLLIRQQWIIDHVLGFIQVTHRKYGHHLLFLQKWIIWLEKYCARLDKQLPLYEDKQQFVRFAKHHQELHQAIAKNPQKQIEAMLMAEQTPIDKLVIPLKKVQMLKSNETIGPVLLQELHDSNYGSFVVYDKKPSQLIGVLDQGVAMSQATKQTKVGDLIDERIVYLPTEATYQQALTTFAETSSPLSVIIDDQNEPVGALYIQDIIRELFETPEKK